MIKRWARGIGGEGVDANMYVCSLMTERWVLARNEKIKDVLIVRVWFSCLQRYISF